MYCRRCKKRKIEKAGLCPVCEKRYLAASRNVVMGAYEERQSQKRKREKPIGLFGDFRFWGFTALLAYTLLIPLVYVADTERRLGNSVILAGLLLIGLTTLIVFTQLAIQFIITLAMESRQKDHSAPIPLGPLSLLLYLAHHRQLLALVLLLVAMFGIFSIAYHFSSGIDYQPILRLHSVLSR